MSTLSLLIVSIAHEMTYTNDLTNNSDKLNVRLICLSFNKLFILGKCAPTNGRMTNIE